MTAAPIPKFLILCSNFSSLLGSEWGISDTVIVGPEEGLPDGILLGSEE
eukprot:CAMPEP_0195506560 /NCGR_PEP_ID=MMETSP0794_2-20130614/130_1 /TAXON_ID=515487 /ORGANISM="Stephanopyxis turris, Strain CCMP 815" /LENGTH=48 /DNA_ID= /DNA_START= /DNA_END= /DNA_ORIENTATION=